MQSKGDVEITHSDLKANQEVQQQHPS